MRAELMVLGKRLDMAPRTHRRNLVVLIYFALAAMMAGFWSLDHWRVTGVYMFFSTILVNRVLLGGYNTGGLIKKFDGKPPRQRMEPPPFLTIGLRLYTPQLEERDYRNDERELAQRDRAHYQAYQVISVALIILWAISDWVTVAPRLLAYRNLLLYGLVLAAVVLSQTLPQAILLWSEPDMEPFDGEEDIR